MNKQPNEEKEMLFLRRLFPELAAQDIDAEFQNARNCEGVSDALVHTTEVIVSKQKHKAQVSALVELGFQPRPVKLALQKMDWNEEDTIDWLKKAAKMKGLAKLIYRSGRNSSEDHDKPETLPSVSKWENDGFSRDDDAGKFIQASDDMQDDEGKEVPTLRKPENVNPAPKIHSMSNEKHHGSEEQAMNRACGLWKNKEKYSRDAHGNWGDIETPVCENRKLEAKLGPEWKNVRNWADIETPVGANRKLETKLGAKCKKSASNIENFQNENLRTCEGFQHSNGLSASSQDGNLYGALRKVDECYFSRRGVISLRAGNHVRAQKNSTRYTSNNRSSQQARKEKRLQDESWRVIDRCPRWVGVACKEKQPASNWPKKSENCCNLGRERVAAETKRVTATPKGDAWHGVVHMHNIK